MNPVELQSLAVRVGEAKAADRELDLAIAQQLRQPFSYSLDNVQGIALDIRCGAYTGSLDASLALVARVLPGGWWTVERDSTHGFRAALPVNSADDRESYGPTPALALLSALLSALAASQTSDELPAEQTEPT